MLRSNPRLAPPLRFPPTLQQLKKKKIQKSHQILQNTKKKTTKHLLWNRESEVKEEWRLETVFLPPVAPLTLRSRPQSGGNDRRSLEPRATAAGRSVKRLLYAFFWKLCSHGDILSGNTRFSAAPLHTVINSRHPIVYSPITHTVFHLLAKRPPRLKEYLFPTFFTSKGVKTARSYSWLVLDVTSRRMEGRK